MNKIEEKEQTQINYWGDTPEEEYYKDQGIKGTQSYTTSPRGLTLFTRSWLPISTPPRGIIFMVHGYGNDISWTFQTTPIFLAQMGFACFACDLEGHGKSQGLIAYVPNVDLVVQDCFSFFNSIKQDPTLNSLPSFLYGESMGAAICLLIHLSHPTAFTGALLVSPMCRISEKVRPTWPIPQLLSLLSAILPTLPIVPTTDLIDKSIRLDYKKSIANLNPLRYKGKPRLGTVKELVRVTDWLSARLGEVRIPFLVVHGSGDVVTDPEVSRALYEEAKSEDKSIRIYDGMMHSLLFGESDENIEAVRRDILSWLNHRCRDSSA